MKDWQMRVAAEAREVTDKAKKLHEFMRGDVFKTLQDEDRLLLAAQHSAMLTYAGIVTLRASRFLN